MPHKKSTPHKVEPGPRSTGTPLSKHTGSAFSQSRRTTPFQVGQPHHSRERSEWDLAHDSDDDDDPAAVTFKEKKTILHDVTEKAPSASRGTRLSIRKMPNTRAFELLPNYGYMSRSGEEGGITIEPIHRMKSTKEKKNVHITATRKRPQTEQFSYGESIVPEFIKQ